MDAFAPLATAIALVATLAGTPAPVAVSLDGRPASLADVRDAHCAVVVLERLDCFRAPRDRDAFVASSELSAAGTLAAAATLYENTGYGGASLAVSASIANLGAYGWNDRASSSIVASGHAVVFYKDTSYGGATLSRTGPASDSSLGMIGWSDVMSSVAVSY